MWPLVLSLIILVLYIASIISIIRGMIKLHRNMNARNQDLVKLLNTPHFRRWRETHKHTDISFYHPPNT
jgi:hypothetical protein